MNALPGIQRALALYRVNLDNEALRDDPRYADKAKRIAALARDPVEIIAAEWKQFAPMVAMPFSMRSWAVS